MLFLLNSSILMEPLKARMDFELEHISVDFAERLEAAVNREIEAARQIRVRILPRAGAFQIPELIRTKITGHESKGKINKRRRMAVE